MPTISDDIRSVKSVATEFATKRAMEYFAKNCKGRGSFNKMKLKFGYANFLSELKYCTQNGEFTCSHKLLVYLDELIELAEKDLKESQDQRDLIFKKLEAGEKLNEEEIKLLKNRSPFEDACYMFLGELQIYVWILWESFRLKNPGQVTKMELEDIIYKRDLKKFAINPRYKKSLEEIAEYNENLKKVNSEVSQDLQ